MTQLMIGVYSPNLKHTGILESYETSSLIMITIVSVQCSLA